MARFVMPERAFDTHYDPVYCSSADPQTLYRAQPASGGPVDTLQNTENLVTAVQGAHRYKYMKRPIVPFLHAVPPDILLAPPVAQHSDADLLGEQQDEAAGGSKTVGTQSDYRESEAQTVPYTTDHVVKPGENPEILTLEAFTYGNGLPMGQTEVELVERARLKRLVEGNYPPATDDRSFALRAKQMELIETRGWDDRESDLKKEQDARLEVLENNLDARSKALEAKHDARVDQLRQVKLLQSESEVAIVQKRRIKAFRKLSEAQKHMVPEKTDRDIVTEYANYGSEVYAPITNKGRSKVQDKNAAQFEVNPQQLNSLEGVGELEETMPAALIRSNVKPQLQDSKKVGTAGRRLLVGAKHLGKVHNHLKEMRDPPEKHPDRAQVLRRYHKPPPLERPGTPRLEPEGPPEGVEEAVVLLQQLLRGRVVQNQVWEAKEKRRQLVEELRSVEGLEDTEEEWQAQEEQVEKQAQMNRALTGGANLLIGDAIGRSLDFLSKELVHSEEEERLCAIMKQAEALREQRETKETATRKAEEERRARDDEAYTQIHFCHQRSADAFLDVLLPGIMEESASNKAMADILTKSSKLNSIIGELETDLDDPNSVMQDLVSHFLLPEVEREEQRWGKRETHNKYKKAAYDALVESGQ
eukprot:TRINITY_DN5485_c0_g1_i1.p1 TRINITY_DN5485_c0_g1~~TRINITY_DN5485_c0_g1_i1.p1  ORF type:complete len:644 (+),score=177.24 TRINITY_DN5485_c0_g1_i1:130-2061(+)